MAGRGSEPGERRGGRQKGTPNKLTAALKDAILTAAELVGSDGEGKDGVVGYLTMVAKSDVKAFAALLGKVLPMQVTGEDGAALKVEIVHFCEQGEPTSG